MTDYLPMTNDRGLLSPQQLADELKIPVGTIYQWNYRGVGPKRLTVGRHVRYRRADVEAWLAEREQNAQSA